LVKLAGSSGDHVWSKSFGNTGSNDARDVASDNSGKVIITGGFEDTINFGNGSLTSAGGQDVFIAKFSPGGNLLSSGAFGDGSTPQSGFRLATDNYNNIIVLGEFEGTVDFDGWLLTNLSAPNCFLVKFGPVIATEPTGVPVLSNLGLVVLFLFLLFGSFFFIAAKTSSR
jgi:hypothetical protein